MTVQETALTLGPVFFHWPATSGVLETFLTGPVDQSTGPTMVFMLVLAMASMTAAGSSMSAARFTTSATTSNRAWRKPRGCVHGLPVALV